MYIFHLHLPRRHSHDERVFAEQICTDGPISVSFSVCREPCLHHAPAHKLASPTRISVLCKSAQWHDPLAKVLSVAMTAIRSLLKLKSEQQRAYLRNSDRALSLWMPSLYLQTHNDTESIRIFQAAAFQQSGLGQHSVNTDQQACLKILRSCIPFILFLGFSHRCKRTEGNTFIIL